MNSTIRQIVTEQSNDSNIPHMLTHSNNPDNFNERSHKGFCSATMECLNNTFLKSKRQPPSLKLILERVTLGTTTQARRLQVKIPVHRYIKRRLHIL